MHICIHCNHYESVFIYLLTESKRCVANARTETDLPGDIKLPLLTRNSFGGVRLYCLCIYHCSNVKEIFKHNEIGSGFISV